MIVVVMGVSGSGKSTIGAKLAQAMGWDFADADWFHPPANIHKMSRGLALSEEDREPWLETLRAQIRQWLTQNRSVVLACSALRASHRHLLIVDPKRMRLVYLKGSVDLLRRRLAGRPHHFMSTELLPSQMDTLEEPSDAITVDASPPPDAIVQRIRTALASSDSPKS